MNRTQHLDHLNRQLALSQAALARVGGPSTDPVARHWEHSVAELRNLIDRIGGEGEPVMVDGMDSAGMDACAMSFRQWRVR